LEGFEEGLNAGFLLGLKMDFNPEADVLDPTLEMKFLSQAVDKRPESHALDDPENNNPVGISILRQVFFRFRHVFVFSLDYQE